MAVTDMRLLITLTVGAVSLLAVAVIACWDCALAEDDTSEPPVDPVAEEENQPAAEEDADESIEAEEAVDESSDDETSEGENDGEDGDECAAVCIPGFRCSGEGHWVSAFSRSHKGDSSSKISCSSITSSRS